MNPDSLSAQVPDIADGVRSSILQVIVNKSIQKIRKKQHSHIMVEDFLPQKYENQFKVESGGGDSGQPLLPATNPGWNVTCPQRRSWLDRWPEMISAFWMSGMLLGIFCLILYGLGLGVIRQQPLMMLHCNSSRPGSEVYLHHIVQRSSSVPFSQFSEYLSNMASMYTALRFNVVFLMDDTQRVYRGSRHLRLFNRLVPYHPRGTSYRFDENNQQELIDFHLKYQNVNVTIIPISKYMAMTPLRYIWKTIPMSHLAFYARVISVWQTGGIGIDLSTFSTQYYRHQQPDRRIREILKQHNIGIKPDEYTYTLNKIDRDEQNEFVSLFYGMMHQFFNETRSFLNRTLLFPQDIVVEKEAATPGAFIRTHRNKRELHSENASQNTSNEGVKESTTDKVKILNTTDITIVHSAYVNGESITTNNSSANTDLSVLSRLFKQPEVNESQSAQRTLNKTNSTFEFIHTNISEPPQIVMIYDFAVFSDNIIGPSYMKEPVSQPNMPVMRTQEHTSNSVSHPIKGPPYILSLNLEGSFIASSAKLHPFLAHIISAGCQRMPPRFAIQDAVIDQCSTILRDDVYCSNIFLL